MNDDCGWEIWEEVAAYGDNFYREAFAWWNSTLTNQEKALVVGMTYYDFLLHEVEHVDEYLQYLKKQYDKNKEEE